MEHIFDKGKGNKMYGKNHTNSADYGGEQREQRDRSFSGHEGFWVTPESMPLPDGWRGMKVLKRASQRGVSPRVVKDLVDNPRSSVWLGPGREPLGSGVLTYHVVWYSGKDVYHIIYGLKVNEAKLVHACQGFCADKVRKAKTLLG